MALLALTNDNLAFLKRSLRPMLPGVGSSHLSEALAAACGCRTGIALATRLREAENEKMPSVVAIDQDRLAARLSDLGHLDAVPPMLAELVRSPDLPDRIWAVVKGRDIPALNAWFRKCERRNIPYVYITTARKHARMDWDWITVNPAFDGVPCDDDESKLVDRLFKTFQANVTSSPKAMFDGSAFVGHIEKLSLEDAHALADAIFELLYGALRKAQGTVSV